MRQCPNCRAVCSFSSLPVKSVACGFLNRGSECNRNLLRIGAERFYCRRRDRNSAALVGLRTTLRRGAPFPSLPVSRNRSTLGQALADSCSSVLCSE